MLTHPRASDFIKIFPIWLLAVLLTGILAPNACFAAKEAPDPGRATLLALDDCDEDNDHSTPPFGDMILVLNSEGQLVRKIHGLTVGRSACRCRAISVSEDGRYFSVLENTLSRISMYDTSTGAWLWTLSGLFGSAAFANELLYVLAVDSVYAVDRTGTVVKHSRIDGGGIDIAYDRQGQCLWIVGMDIRKFSLDLELQFQVRLPAGTSYGGAFSVDVNPDGSAWVACRNAYELEGSGNQLLKVSPEGRLLRVVQLDFCPQRVRVDKSDRSVWTTGRVRRKDYSRIGDVWPETTAELDRLVEVGVQSCTRKYDSDGRLLFAGAWGGTSIEVDPSDGSVWIAGDGTILHCSSTGSSLSTYTGTSTGKKCLAIVP